MNAEQFLAGVRAIFEEHTDRIIASGKKLGDDLDAFIDNGGSEFMKANERLANMILVAELRRAETRIDEEAAGHG